jgi:anaerobic ribonucleoside-triphosphate reductase activating protein
MPFRRLESEYSDLLTKLDAVIPEPYVRTAQEGKIWRGSLNQSLVPLSELGRQRYRSYIDKDAPVEGGLEVRVTDGEFWCVGIPRRGDLDKLVQVADRAGVTLRNLSWRA